MGQPRVLLVRAAAFSAEPLRERRHPDLQGYYTRRVCVTVAAQPSQHNLIIARCCEAEATTLLDLVRHCRARGPALGVLHGGCSNPKVHGVLHGVHACCTVVRCERVTHLLANWRVGK